MRGFAMDIKLITKPLAFALFAHSGSSFDGRVAFRSAREAAYRRVSAPSLACPGAPKTTKLPDGPVRASAYPYRNGVPTADACPQHRRVPTLAVCRRPQPTNSKGRPAQGGES